MSLTGKITARIFVLLKNLLFSRPEYYYILLTDAVFSLFMRISFSIDDFGYLRIFTAYLSCVLVFEFFAYSHFSRRIKLTAAALLPAVSILLIMLLLKNSAAGGTDYSFEALRELVLKFSGFSRLAFHEIAFFMLPLVFFLNFSQLILIYFRRGLAVILVNVLFFYGLTVSGYERNISVLSGFFVLETVFFAGIFIYQKRTKNTYSLKRQHLKFIFSISALTSLAAVLISLPFAEFETGKNLTLKFWSFIVTETSPEFGLKMSGFSKSGDLGGKILTDNTVVMRVRGGFPGYLRGTVYRYYDGRKWYHTAGTEEKSYFNEEGSVVFDGKTQLRRKITVEPLHIRTSSYFTPPYTEDVESSGNAVVETADNLFSTGDESAVSSEYEITYFEQKNGIQEENFEDASAAEKNAKADNEGIPMEFTSLPGNLNPQIGRLSQSICRGLDSDSGKTAAISDYLQKNFTYDVNVGKVPENREFTEYFLFSQKKGYCVYFATAAAVLARSAGIPVRYVEGYRMQQVRGADDSYLVTNSMAHAWIEFFDREKSQWVISDPTPGSAYNTWVLSQIPVSIGGTVSVQNNDAGTIVTDEEKLNDSVKAVRKMRRRQMMGSFFHSVTASLITAALILMLVAALLSVFNFVMTCGYVLNLFSLNVFYVLCLQNLRLGGIIFSKYDTSAENMKFIENEYLKKEFIELAKIVNSGYFGNASFPDFDRKKFHTLIKKTLPSKLKNPFRQLPLFFMHVKIIRLSFRLKVQSVQN